MLLCRSIVLVTWVFPFAVDGEIANEDEGESDDDDNDDDDDNGDSDDSEEREFRMEFKKYKAHYYTDKMDFECVTS